MGLSLCALRSFNLLNCNDWILVAGSLASLSVSVLLCQVMKIFLVNAFGEAVAPCCTGKTKLILSTVCSNFISREVIVCSDMSLCLFCRFCIGVRYSELSLRTDHQWSIPSLVEGVHRACLVLAWKSHHSSSPTHADGNMLKGNVFLDQIALLSALLLSHQVCYVLSQMLLLPYLKTPK